MLLFASILAHEFGHALVARRRGVKIEEIDLWLLGGVARMTGARRPPTTSCASRSQDRR
ncbi:MAG: site-2 protease family protein [Gaiellaceae bacterium]